MDTKLPHPGAIAPHDPALRQAVALGHETRDVSVKWLFIFAGSLLVVLVLILVAVGGIFKGYAFADQRLDRRAAGAEPGARSQVRATPDYQGPLLQVQPEQDLKSMQRQNAIDLNSYGWVDQPAGVVRLPIDRAMDLLVQRGLPPVSPGLTVEAMQRQRAQPQVWGQALRP